MPKRPQLQRRRAPRGKPKRESTQSLPAGCSRTTLLRSRPLIELLRRPSAGPKAYRSERRGNRSTRPLPQKPPEPSRGSRPMRARFQSPRAAAPRKRKLCCKSKTHRQSARYSLAIAGSSETPRACGDSRAFPRRPLVLARPAAALPQGVSATPPDLEAAKRESRFDRRGRNA